jgi:hypothetical protein
MESEEEVHAKARSRKENAKKRKLHLRLCVPYYLRLRQTEISILLL